MQLEFSVISFTLLVLATRTIANQKRKNNQEGTTARQQIDQSSSRSFASHTMNPETTTEQKFDEGSSSGTATAVGKEPGRVLLERTLLDSFAVQSIKIGDSLGLYVALFEAQGNTESGYASLLEICERAMTDTRLTYEWLQFQVRVSFLSIITDKDGQERFCLDDSMAKYLLPPAYSAVSMVGAFRLSTCMMNLQPVIKSFETGTQSLFLPGEPADVKFEEDMNSDTKSVENRIRAARETFCTRFFRYRFVETVLKHIDSGPELCRMLESGEIDVAEVFCGATSGTLSITLATQFRSARFFGFEPSHVSLTRARDLSHAAETKNARFYDVRERSVSFGPPPSTSKKRKVRSGFGLIVTFMSMSMIDAETQIALFKDVRQALDKETNAPWIIMDLDHNQDDLAYALCLGMSMLHFLPSLSAPQACTPFTEKRCQQLATIAGFSSVTKGPNLLDELLVKLNVFVLRV